MEQKTVSKLIWGAVALAGIGAGAYHYSTKRKYDNQKRLIDKVSKEGKAHKFVK